VSDGARILKVLGIAQEIAHAPRRGRRWMRALAAAVHELPDNVLEAAARTWQAAPERRRLTRRRGKRAAKALLS
jgi:hypothetical protein